MYTKALLFTATLSIPLFAQISEFDEPEQQPRQKVIVEDTITDELPAPLPETTIYKPGVSTTASSPRVELVPKGENLETAKKLAGMGAGLYFTGLGLSYGAVLPLSISFASNHDTALSVIGSIVSLVADGFKISGTIRNGIGGSIAYNISLQQGLNADRNINWGFYKAGWAFAVIGQLTGLMQQLGGGGMNSGASGTIATISLTSRIASDVMWTVGVINSLSYVRKVRHVGTEHSRISVIPVYYSAQKSTGAVAVWTF